MENSRKPAVDFNPSHSWNVSLGIIREDLRLTAVAVAGCEAEHNTMSTFNIAINNLLEIIRII